MIIEGVDFKKPLYWDGKEVEITKLPPDTDTSERSLIELKFKSSPGKEKFVVRFLSSDNGHQTYDTMYLSRADKNFGWGSDYEQLPLSNDKRRVVNSLIRDLRVAIASLREQGYEVECTLMPPVPESIIL